MAQHRYSLLGLRDNIPLTLLTVANLFAAWFEQSPKRKWWPWAAVIIVLERLATFAYFIPTMISLMGSERSDLEIKATLSQWLLFNYGRHVLAFLGWLLALKALSLPSEHRNTTGA
jgi:protein-S-isoprenylcysteine O-methyltransferase Ste14